MNVELITNTAETIPPQFAEYYNPDEKRVGRLVLGDVTLFTIERPFVANPAAPEGFDPGVPFISAVPLGEYELVLRDSPAKGQQWHFHNPDLGVMLDKSDCTDVDEDGNPTWQRYSTMFHIGNFVTSVVGCAGVGMRLHQFAEPHGLGVAASGLGIYQLKEKLDPKKTHRLVIK